MKPVKPWPHNTECPHDGFAEFKKALSTASYHNAAPGMGEKNQALTATNKAVSVAIEQEWPYWAMERMFKESYPLVDWTGFMQAYLNKLVEK